MVSLQATGANAAAAQKSWMPTRKWVVATVFAIGAVATLWVTKGSFDRDVAVALIGAAVQAVATYIMPNLDTPGGVPLRS